eukprot:2802303-Rhodomonas_salina.1
MSGTEAAYGARGCPVLTRCMAMEVGGKGKGKQRPVELPPTVLHVKKVSTNFRPCGCACSTGIHPEIQCKKPQFQYNLYQEC